MADNAKVNEWLAKLTQPENLIADNLGILKQNKITSKPLLLSIEKKETKKLLLEFLDENNFQQLFSYGVHEGSKQGGFVLFLTQLNNEWKIGICPQDKVIFISYDITKKPISITLLANIITGNRGRYFIFETHDANGITRQVKMDNSADQNMTPQDAFEQGQPIPMQDLLESEGLYIKPFVKTNTMTAFYIPNKTLNIEDLFGVSDSYLAQAEIDNYVLAVKNLRYTLRYTYPRLIITKADGETINGQAAENDADAILGEGSILIKKNTAWDESQPPLSTFAPDPNQLTASMKAVADTYNSVLLKAGYANPDDADSAQKSTLEVSQIRDSEASSLAKYISILQKSLRGFIQSWSKINKLELGDEWGVNIQVFDVRAEIEKTDTVIKMMNAGLEDLESAIASLHNIDAQAAKVKIDKIQKEKQQKQDGIIKKPNNDKVEGVDNEKTDMNN